MKLVSITTLVFSSLVGVHSSNEHTSYEHDRPSTHLLRGSTLYYDSQGSTKSNLIESNSKAKVGTGVFLEWRDDGGCEEGSFYNCCDEGYCNWMYDYKYVCNGGGFYCSMSSPDQGGPTPYFPPRDEEAY